MEQFPGNAITSIDTHLLLCYYPFRLNIEWIAQPAQFGRKRNYAIIGLSRSVHGNPAQARFLQWFSHLCTGRLFLFQRALIARIKDIMTTAKCKQCSSIIILKNEQATALAARYGVLCASCLGNGRQWTRATYQEYLQSSHWKSFRARALRHYGRKCHLCGTGRGTIDIHHNDYSRLGNELYSDVIPLCRVCHPERRI